MAKIEEKIENLLQKTIENIGYDLYDVEYAKERKKLFFTYIHRQAGWN